ncbi:uncharacterized protein [Solanum tuberosum]|uniref:uncharacterized protein n=1 Tax=Solanum tuberosum TaxID=4113 RepID=UPI00073A00AE|nr:PREDICTED: uncharacterized protein LOC107063011 [Solanum tuberosum]
MELSIASHGKAFPFANMTKEKEFKKGMTSKIQSKESLVVKETFLNVTTKKKLKEEKAPSQYPREERPHATLKELEPKVHPFAYSEVSMILDEFLAKKVINLPESKRPEETNKIGGPRYCKLHRVFGHPTSKCFILKEKIMMLVSEGIIIIDQDDKAEANHASVAPNQKKCSRSTFLQFGSLTPIEGYFPRKTLEGSLEIDTTKKIKLMVGVCTNDTKESKGGHNPAITQEHQTDEKVTRCCAAIAFTDDDLLLGSKLHNRPLFVVGSIREQHLNRILIDGGSAVNIMPNVVLRKLGISIDELFKIDLTIQDFNQGGQRSIGKIRVGLSIGDVKSNTLIHVIDAKT